MRNNKAACVSSRVAYGEFSFAAVAAAQHPANPPFKFPVSVVEVDVAVAGREVPFHGLQLGDFAVQDKRSFCSPTLRLAGGNRARCGAAVRSQQADGAEADPGPRGCGNGPAELRGSDRVAAMSFNQDAHLELPLTGDLKAAKVGFGWLPGRCSAAGLRFFPRRRRRYRLIAAGRRKRGCLCAGAAHGCLLREL